jgi:hypothetical protein
VSESDLPPSPPAPKRRRGRPKTPPDAEKTFEVTLPKHHYDYLHFLADKKRRFGISAKAAAEYLLIRELDALFRADYHAKEIPEE